MYEKQKRYSRKKIAEAADVGEIPPVANPERREACRLDLHRFLTTYFPASTGLKPFSPDHVRAITRIQQCALEGGLFVQAFPRGFAKTTISENSAIWAVLYGHRRFVPIFGADANSAAGNIDSIKLELAENDLLHEDFPEVCHPIRALEGKPQRCASQTYSPTCTGCDGGDEECPQCKGQGNARALTHIEWTADTIVLPSIPGSVASGAILSARGLMGGSRGMKHKGPDGVQQRPDFVIIDDPQTDDSASTELQVTKRLDVIRKSILKLGGHSRRMAVVMNATVIRRGDMVEKLLDPKKFPAWQGERIKMVRKWADVHDTLWLNDYARLRNSFDPDVLGDQQRAHREATDFYTRNRAAMDAGCQVAWEHCYDPATELSATQHAYNSFIDDGEEVFASECQNEPLERESDKAFDSLTADQIAAKVNNIARGRVPVDGSRVVAFIDVQKNALFWVVCAFSEDFTGYVLDYGTFPDQRRSYFAYREIRNTLQKATKTDSQEAAIYAGLDALVTNIMGREWVREGGTVLRPERILIDANWGESTDTVYQFCRRSAHSAVLLPSHGRYVGAKSRPLNDSAPKPGERRGWNWRLTFGAGKRYLRYVLFDANAFKTFLRGRWLIPIGGRGCLSLFGDSPQEHRLFADHQSAEVGTRVEANGRGITEWSLRPHRPDNHWLDCLAGCAVAASMLGCNLLVNQAPARPKQSPKRRAVSYL